MTSREAKLLVSQRILSAVVVLAALGSATQALAIPAFARKFGMACTACHEAWPKLNAQGWAFRDNGYQWMAGKDNTVKIDPAYWPIAYRQTVGYMGRSDANQPTNSGPKSVGWGRLGVSGVDLLFAGTLTDNVSFLFVYEPLLTNVGFNIEFPGQSSSIANGGGEGGFFESAWVRFDNLFGSPYLNIKVGRGSLDVPFDEHRSFFIFNNSYSPYHFHPIGSINPFELGTNAWQLSLEGHNDGSTFRYALSYYQTQLDPGSDGPFASPSFYGHVQYTLFPSRQGLAQVRGGLFAAIGSYPTQGQICELDATGACTATMPGVNTGSILNPNLVPNTGFAHREYYREGIDLDFKFNSVATPIDLRLMGLLGQEHPELTPIDTIGVNPTQSTQFGGFLAEIDWTPMLNFTAALRYDTTRMMQQADASLQSNAGNIENVGLSVRYQLDIIPRTGTALMLELDHTHSVATGYQGLDDESYLAFGGLDFAF